MANGDLELMRARTAARQRQALARMAQGQQAPPIPQPLMPDLIEGRGQQPQQSGGFIQGAAEVASGLAADLTAATQGTTPVVRDLQGNFIRPLASQEDQDIFNELGRVRNAQTQIVLRDPQDGQLKVFMRTPETDETRLESLGRVAAFGALAPQSAAIRATQGTSPTLQRARDFAGARVDPTLGTVTQGTGAARVERGISGTGLDLGQVARAAERSAAQTGQEAARVAERIGASQTTRQAGEALRRAGEGFRESSGRASTRLFNRLNTFIRPNEQFSAQNARAALMEPIKQFDNPALAREFMDPRLGRWFDAVREGGGRLSYNDMKQFRTEIGRLISKPDLTPDANRAQLERVYAALSQDMRAAAASKGREALDTFELANDFFRDRQQRIQQTFRGILGDEVSDEGAFRLFQSLSKEGGARESVQRLRDLRTSVSADDWGDITSGLLREMGRPRASVAQEGFEFSPQTFLTRWNQLSDDARNVLFSEQIGGSQLKRGLDRLARVVSAQREAQKFENVSRTGLAVSIPAATAGAVIDPVTTGLSVVGANVAARLMTSPRFVNWYAGALSRNRTRQQWARALQSLSAAQQGDDDIAEFVRAASEGVTGAVPTNRPQAAAPFPTTAQPVATRTSQTPPPMPATAPNPGAAALLGLARQGGGSLASPLLQGGRQPLLGQAGF